MVREWKTKDFDYELPKELIAQTPVEPRDASRLMVLDKETGAVAHRHFRDITEYLRPGDCLILNDSRVLPARLYGVKEGTGAHVEFLLLSHTKSIGLLRLKVVPRSVPSMYSEGHQCINTAEKAQ